MPVRRRAPRRSRSQATPRAGHRADAGRERGDVVGVDDPLGLAQHDRLDEQPAAEARAANARRGSRRGSGRRSRRRTPRQRRSSSRASAQRGPRGRGQRTRRPGRRGPCRTAAAVPADLPKARSGAFCGRPPGAGLVRRCRWSGIRRSRAPGGRQRRVAGRHADGGAPGLRRLPLGRTVPARRPGRRPADAVVVERQPELAVVRWSCRRTGAARRVSVPRTRSRRTETASITAPASARRPARRRRSRPGAHTR